MALTKILESSKKIRFQDCDPFNHLNNGRYVDYYINSREDQLLENYNIDLFKIIQTEGIGWVVSNNQVAYIKPVFTMEEIVFQSQLISYAPKHIKVEMRMWNKDKTVLKSIAWFGFVPFNLKTNSVALHDEKFMKLFEEVLLPVDEKTFEERELFLRMQERKK
ncbi:acyl-CoA thioesterase [Bacteroidota bacterium]